MTEAMSGKGLIVMLALLGAVLFHAEAASLAEQSGTQGRSAIYVLLIYCIKLCLVVCPFKIIVLHIPDRYTNNRLHYTTQSGL